MLTAVLAFLAAATIVIVSPGPDSLLVMRSVARGGPRAGMGTAAGVLTGLLFVIETALWLGALVWLAQRGARWLQRPAVRRRLERVTGVVLIGFGVRLAVDVR